VTPPGRPSPLTVCALLAGAVLALANAGNHPLTLAALPVVATLLAAELDRSGGLLAVRVVRLASRALPRAVRAEHADDWKDYVLEVGEQGMRPLLAALWIAVRATPPLLFRLRVRLAAGFAIRHLLIACLEYDARVEDEFARRLPARAQRNVRVLAVSLAVPLLPFRAVMLRYGRRISLLQAAGLGLVLQLMIIFGPFGAAGPTILSLAVAPASALWWWCLWLLNGPGRAASVIERVMGIDS